MIGEYVLNEQIGQGQFGKVYLAEKLSRKDERYACKMVSIQNKSEAQVEQMEREAIILSQFDHPNIIKLK